MRLKFLYATVTLGAALLWSAPSYAHCDGLDGPVVGAARKAFDAGNVNPVLIWVQPKDETEVRRAFDEAMAVRKLGPQARDMADRYFFETLVRLHRAGEGASYTGLKPAGRDLGPAIPLADKAVESGSDSELAELLARETRNGLRERLSQLRAKRNYRASDLVAGRGYVASYVAFVHYVEGLHSAAASPAAGHYPEEEPERPAHQE